MSIKKTVAFEHLMELMKAYDPQIQKLAYERFLDGNQLFDSKNHRLKEPIRDLAQARGILLLAQELAKAYDRTLWLSTDEKKLLNQLIAPRRSRRK